MNLTQELSQVINELAALDHIELTAKEYLLKRYIYLKGCEIRDNYLDEGAIKNVEDMIAFTGICEECHGEGFIGGEDVIECCYCRK